MPAVQGLPLECSRDLAAGMRRAMPDSGLDYVSTTAAARETAGWLREWGIAADYRGQRRKRGRERV